MKRRILWLLVCMLLCTTMAACARREAPQLPTAEVQTQPETPEPTQETEPSQAPEEPDQAVSAHGSAAYIHGRTLVVSIFADDAATHWDETTDAADIDQTQEHLRIATEWLTDAVKPYGVTAEFSTIGRRTPICGTAPNSPRRWCVQTAPCTMCRPVIFRRTSPPRS